MPLIPAPAITAQVQGVPPSEAFSQANFSIADVGGNTSNNLTVSIVPRGRIGGPSLSTQDALTVVVYDEDSLLAVPGAVVLLDAAVPGGTSTGQIKKTVTLGAGVSSAPRSSPVPISRPAPWPARSPPPPPAMTSRPSLRSRGASSRSRFARLAEAPPPTIPHLPFRSREPRGIHARSRRQCAPRSRRSLDGELEHRLDHTNFPGHHGRSVSAPVPRELREGERCLRVHIHQRCLWVPRAAPFARLDGHDIGGVRIPFGQTSDLGDDPVGTPLSGDVPVTLRALHSMRTRSPARSKSGSSCRETKLVSRGRSPSATAAPDSNSD